jgi:anti-sigma factor RsiW
MRPDDDKLLVNAYVDGELDLASQLALEERLEKEPLLQAQVDGLRALTHSLRQELDHHAAPADLRARFARAAAPMTAEPQRAPGRLAGIVAWWSGWNGLASGLAFVAVALLAINLAVLHVGEQDRAREDLVASHVRALLSQRPIDVASSDQHTVKPWFASQLDFSPPVKELDLPGTVLLGGRVDYVDGRKVAVVVYQYRKHIVDLYLWPASGKAGSLRVDEVRGFMVAQWTQGGMAHRMVSDMNDAELQALVQACREAQKG